MIHDSLQAMQLKWTGKLVVNQQLLQPHWVSNVSQHLCEKNHAGGGGHPKVPQSSKFDDMKGGSH